MWVPINFNVDVMHQRLFTGGMTRMKPLHPKRSSAMHSVAICLVVKDQDIAEWVDHHRTIGKSFLCRPISCIITQVDMSSPQPLSAGVDRIYIYDDESRVPLLGSLIDYIDMGIVHYNFTFRSPGEETIQMSRYNDCLNQFGDQHAWMAFIDADEVCRPQAAGTCMGMLSSPAFCGLR